MKKENIYVKVNTEKEAKNYRKILKQLGEPISDIYFENFDPETKSHCNLVFCPDGDWTMGAVEEGEQITFGQLIDLLNEPQKIAVKVENEKEFKAIEKHLGKKSFFTSPFQNFSYPVFIYLDGGKYPDEDFVSIDCGEIYLKYYQIIQFADFAEEKGIKLPLFQTMDGADIYENDSVFIGGRGGSKPLSYDDWPIREYIAQVGTGQLHENHYKDENGTYYWAKFSTKQAALEWIEAHKPKTYELDCGIISDKGLAIRNGLTFLNKVEIEVIGKYIQELNKK